MKPAKFDYYRASSLEHACELLTEHGDDAKILAGGQSLIAAMNFRLARPEVLVDVSHVANADDVAVADGGIRIAATTRQRVAERHADVRERIPVLARAIEHIAHFQIRNKGTVGGSIANADPASELPAMALLLDAELEIRSSTAENVTAAEDFFITYMTTSLATDEVLTAIRFRIPPDGSGWGFHETARRAGDFALAGAAALVGLDDAGTCDYARVALFGVAATPVRAHDAESALVGSRPSPELARDAAHEVASVVDPETDVHVTEAYRRRAAEVLAARAIEDAFDRAATARQGGEG